MARKSERRKELIGKLGGKCVKCGYDGPSLVFHHLGGTKDDKNWWSDKNFMNVFNAGLIQLLCANCHHEFHFYRDYDW